MERGKADHSDPAVSPERVAHLCGKADDTFRTDIQNKKGGVVYRTYINKEIEKLCEHAHVAEEKATPRALKKLYFDVQKDLTEKMTRLMNQAYDHLLEAEQMTIGWPEDM